MSDRVFLGITLAGVLLSGAAVYLWKKDDGGAGDPSPADLPNGQRRVKLSEASKSWTEPKEITLAQASKLWIQPDTSNDIPRPDFDREEIADFWVAEVEARRYIKGNKRKVIADILKMLDKYGDCSSVVRNPKQKTEVENSFADDVFDLLAKIPLYRHTLDVAHQMAKRVGRETLVPDALITGLAHDLGKIPMYHDKGYSTGDHPIISAIVLQSFESFIALPNHDDLIQIVRSHHYMRPHNALASMLKDCDGMVRAKEQAAGLNLSVQQEQARMAENNESPVAGQQSITNSVPAADLPQPEPDPSTASVSPLAVVDPTATYVTKEAAKVDSWLDPDLLLAEIKKWINVAKNNGWGAVSMPDGLIYVTPVLFWQALKTVAPEETKAEMGGYETDQGKKDGIMLGAVNLLTEKKNAVAIETMKPGFYTTTTTTLNGKGKPSQKFLVPLRAHAFGLLPSEAEAMKDPALLSLVTSIKPSSRGTV